MRTSERVRLATLFAVSLVGCSDVNLQPLQAEGPPALDDKLALKGSICTKTPSDEAFPVKIMFIIDTSDSMRETDASRQRVHAVQQVIDRYSGNPAVLFSVIAFDAVVSDLTTDQSIPRYFTNTPDWTKISQRLSLADRLTDYQGALGKAYEILTQDMINTSPALRARTKYVVIFFSDGVPDPMCCLHADASCMSFGASPGAMTRPVCTVPKTDWPDQFQLPSGTNPNTGSAWTWDDFTGLFPDLDSGKDYNTPPQLESKVADILQLQDIYNVNEIRFHTGFLFDPNLNPAFITAFGLDRARGESLLRGMATAGNGTFTEFTNGTAINFLNVNYASVKQIYAITNLFAINQSSIPTALGAVPDSDGDGLPDSREDDLRLCSYTKGGASCNLGNGMFRDPLDTDGDGYTDLFEDRMRAFGFDPKVPGGLVAPCNGIARLDSDGDGLRDCEEVILHTDPALFDTDGDRFPDGVEFRAGLDPTKKEDVLADNDSDGTRNGDEILLNYDPNGKEPINALPPKQVYTVTHTQETADGRNCYDFEVKNIQLMTTRGLSGETRGMNTIKVTFMEGPPDDPHDFGTARVACVKARFVEPDLKQPANGHLTLTEDDFFDLNDPNAKCIGPDQPPPKTTAP